MNGEGHDQTEDAESKQDGSTDPDTGDDSNEQEVIVIQDTGFTVKIQAPGIEPFDLQVHQLWFCISEYREMGRRGFSLFKYPLSCSGVSTGNGTGDPPSSYGP